MTPPDTTPPHGHHHHPHPDAPAHHAGSGSAVLDIGDGIGAVLAVVPDIFAGTEIDITSGDHHTTKPPHSHDVHTGVHPRTYYGKSRQIALYPSLPAGTYQLWHPHDSSEIAIVEVHGGHITEVDLDHNR